MSFGTSGGMSNSLWEELRHGISAEWEKMFLWSSVMPGALPLDNGVLLTLFLLRDSCPVKYHIDPLPVARDSSKRAYIYIMA